MKFMKNHHFSTSALFWAFLFIGLAVVLLLEALHLTDAFLPVGLSLWRILLGAVLAWWLIWGLLKLQPFAIFFPLAGEALLFDRWILLAIGSEREEIASVRMMLLVAFLLSIGFTILKHACLPMTKILSGEQIAAKVSAGVSGNSTRYIDCTEPFHSTVENNLGATNVFFSNTELYHGESTLHLENNLGSLTLHVPEDWLVVSTLDNSLGSVSVPLSALANPEKKLILSGENNLGSTAVKYVAAAQEPQEEQQPQE